MPTLKFELTLAASLDDLWAFHQDVSRALPLLSPPGSDVRIIAADLPARVGQQVKMNVRGPLGKRLNWVASIIEFEPPSRQNDSRQARFVDVQLSGPFAAWRHEHQMEETGPGTSRLIDIVTYRVPLGPLGKVADWMFVRRQLESMFRHRHAVTRKELEGGRG
ncbi:SRPBCC family protein [Humisphaera borealis]|uniref:SRPBCC family protein n=1 Tax=Humisphaera borealis TaxID=2807512 RepID=A0A7M2X3A1_9BACT|nr:SRPBCC family protein [Humisphaera borealis]QOV92155.1 SRPBCC family protein [Humisphaera borealis]